MKSASLPKLLSLILGVLLITSVLNINTTEMNQTDDTTASFHREPFRLAATYTPGEYPSGLTLIDGDILNATGGGSFNVTGNFIIGSGAIVTIVPGYKIVVYADNIIINGILDCDYAGYAGGTVDHGNGTCVPSSGGGHYGEDLGGGGGGGAHGSDGTDGAVCYAPGGGAGGSGGLEYGEPGFADLIPNASDISLGAGGGAGGWDPWFDYFGAGGAGGGGVYLEATDTILVSGTITCNGEDGEDCAEDDPPVGGGGGGGGAGGGILLYGDIIQISGVLTTVNSYGGLGAIGGSPFYYTGGDGGAGSGGRIKLAYKTSLITTGSTISEGSGGTFNISYVDDVIPTIELTGATNNTIHRSATSIEVNISDSRNIQIIRYNWDNGANYTILLNDSSYQLVTPIPAFDGTHNLKVFAKDVPGNWNHQIFTFIYDDTSPIIILNSPSNNTVHHSGLVIDYTVFDVISLNEVLYNWDGLGSNESLPDPYEILLPLGDGEHILTLYASDIAGNLETKVYSFVTDDTSPTITSPEDITYTEGSTGHLISWTLTDENPSIYIIIMDNETLESDIWVSGMEVNITVDGLSAGVYVYTIIVFDEANNFITDTVIVTVQTIPTTTTTTTTTTPEATTTPTSPLFDADTLILMMASGIGGAAVVVIIVLIISRKRGG